MATNQNKLEIYLFFWNKGRNPIARRYRSREERPEFYDALLEVNPECKILFVCENDDDGDAETEDEGDDDDDDDQEEGEDSDNKDDDDDDDGEGFFYQQNYYDEDY